MKLLSCVVLFCLVWPSAANSQPRWSADVRAKREMEWMKDSLRLSKDQLTKAGNIVLHYEQQIDMYSSESPNTREKLATQKDADMKRLLNKAQYLNYYKREDLVRQREKKVYKDGHQPE